MSALESQIYDSTAKVCVAVLAQWFYDRVPTGVAAVVGRELSQELIHIFGKHRRLCDLLLELTGVKLNGQAVEAVALYDIQARARGDEIHRNAGYAGRILENERFWRVEFFVQLLFLLTETPERFRTRIHGFPNVFQLFVIDLTKVDGLELLKEGIPEAAVLATLSAVVPRNLLIAGIVEILTALPTLQAWSAWTEKVFAFAKLRKDYRIFTMELLQEIKRTTPDDQRQAELRFIYGAFIEEGYDMGIKDGVKKGIKKGIEKGIKKGIKKGIEKGIEKGEDIGRQKERSELAQKMREKGYDPAEISALTGIPKEQIPE